MDEDWQLGTCEDALQEGIDQLDGLFQRLDVDFAGIEEKWQAMKMSGGK